MPGICGVIASGPDAGATALLAEMVGRLRHHPWYRESRYLDPEAGVALARVSLGLVNPAAQPAFNEERTLLAVMDGEIYDHAEQRRTLEAAGHRFQGDSHAELLGHGFEELGDRFFRGLSGQFVAALWDARQRRLTLATDRFGMRPLYLAQLPGRLLFASEIKALLADPKVPRRSSARGLAQFFTFGHLFGEDTLFDAVRALPPAACFTWDADMERLTPGRYWRLEAHPASNGVREEEILDRIDAAFQRAVDRRVDATGRLGLSLSGGLDARTILAVIDHDTVPIQTVSSGMEGSLDHDCAARLAALTNRRHHVHVLDSTFLARYGEHLQHMVHLTDGQYLCQCIVMPTLPYYREQGIEILMRGHAGELMHMDKAYNYSLDRAALALRDEAGLHEWMWRHLRAYMLEAVEGELFRSPHQSLIEGLARDSLRECLRDAAPVEPPLHRVWHVFLSQRLHRETALSMVEFGSLLEPRLPYVDNDLVDALLAAPPHMKLGDRIQAHILRKRRPAFLRVVNSNTGVPMGAGRLRRFLGKARMKVLARLGVKGYQPYERLGLWLRRELRPLVQEILLGKRCQERGIFNPDTVEKVVQQHFHKERNHTYLILAMMIFETGQREFIDGDAPSGMQAAAALHYSPAATPA